MTSPTTSTPEEILHAIQHVEITAEDPAQVRSFLERTFDWEFEETGTPSSPYLMFSTPQGHGGGGIVAPKPGQPVGVTPYINVDDAEEKLHACEEAGAEILVPITEVPGMGRFFWFTVPGAPPMACWESKESR